LLFTTITHHDPNIGKGDAAALTTRRPNVQMPDEYLPPNKILFVQNLPDTVTKDQLSNLFNQCVFVPLSYLSAADRSTRYPNLHEVRLIPTKKDIAFVEYVDENSSTTAKDALHNFKIDGENKIKVQPAPLPALVASADVASPDHLREEDMTRGGRCTGRGIMLSYLHVVSYVLSVSSWSATRGPTDTASECGTCCC
jgi:hypothetical protein